jgi:hypothetical protein
MRGSTNISKTDPNRPDYVVKPQKALKAVVDHFLPPILQVSLDCGGSQQRKNSHQALEAQETFAAHRARRPPIQQRILNIQMMKMTFLTVQVQVQTKTMKMKMMTSSLTEQGVIHRQHHLVVHQEMMMTMISLP